MHNTTVCMTHFGGMFGVMMRPLLQPNDSDCRGGREVEGGGVRKCVADGGMGDSVSNVK